MGHSSSSVTDTSNDSAEKRYLRSVKRSAKKRSRLNKTTTCRPTTTTRLTCDIGNNIVNDSQSKTTTQQLEQQELSCSSDSHEHVENKIDSTSTNVQTNLTCIDLEGLEK